MLDSFEPMNLTQLGCQRYYEADALRYEERAIEATAAGYHDIAAHLSGEAARFRAHCVMLKEPPGSFLHEQAVFFLESFHR
jgi:hypothetical protein